MCGEKIHQLLPCRGARGSPPRVRGKVPQRVQWPLQSGITPACAGKSSRQPGAGRWRRDHPRVCGEKFTLSSSTAVSPGSPPRMRGKVQPDADGCRPPRITPAYAGKRMLYARAVRRDRDHPRVCGEKRPAVDGKRPLRGSPPHVRGKVKDPVPVSALVGITPACAGKSLIGCCITGA